MNLADIIGQRLEAAKARATELFGSVRNRMLDAAQAGVDDYRAAMTGVRSPAGAAYVTDAGQYLDAQGNVLAPEAEPQIFRALTLFGGAAPWAKGAGMAARKGLEAGVNAARHASDLPLDEASRMARAKAMYEAAVQKAMDEYDYVGLRTAETPITESHRSRVWVDGEPTEQVLDGLSVSDARDLKKAMQMHVTRDNTFLGEYFGDYTAVVAGNKAKAGEDAGELIISDPTIIFQRSRKAAFDPAKKDSADLLASVAAVPVGAIGERDK